MKQNLNTRIVEKLLENTPQEFCPPVFGRIVSLDVDRNQILVDFKNNPSEEALEAKLVNPLIYLEDLEESLDRTEYILLDFEDGKFDRPLIRDIYFSVADQNKRLQGKKGGTVHIRAERIILEGEESVTIKSGDTSTTYIAGRSEISTEGRQIRSSATLLNQLKGGSIDLN
ncbi:MAG: hypothetical protein GY786_07905 [Proteobacteria bacterium]|nr:hypothetical protein [Pseudomonadota bacterium]